MSEKALLKEIEKEEQKQIERKLASIKQQAQKEQEKSSPTNIDNKKMIFSSASFPKEEVEKLKAKYAQSEVQKEEEQEVNKIESKVAQVIEKPNYDYMETLTEKQRKKIFSVKKEESVPQAKPKKSKFKMAIVSILFAIFGVWGIVNIATIDSVSSQIAEVTSQYELNLINYLKNLYTLDATNSENMKNLFEVIPENENPPNVIENENNWFGKICDFLGGLFGG